MINKKKISIAVVALYVLIVLAGFFIAPPVVKNIAQKKLSEALKRPVTLESIKINPLALSATIKGVRIGEPDSEKVFLSLGELYVNMEASSIIKRGLVISEVKLSEPYVSIRRKADMTYNFSDLLAASSKTDEKPSEPARFAIHNITLNGGKVEFQDDPKSARHVVDQVNLAVPFVSNLRSDIKSYIQPFFEARVNGAPIRVEGKAKPFAETRETAISINLRDIDIPQYLAYSPVELPLKLASGKFSVDAELSFIQAQGAVPRLSLSGSTGLRDILLDDKAGARLMELPALDIKIASASIFERIFRLSEVSLDRASVDVIRSRSGKINLLEPFFIKSSPVAAAPKKDDAAALILSVDELRLRGASVRYSDASFSAPFHTDINDINITVKGFGTERDKTGAYEFTAVKDKDETLGARGEFSVAPLMVNGTLAIAGVELKRLAPIYKTFASIAIDSGRLGVTGGYAFKDDRPEVHDLGVTVENLKLRDPSKDKPFISVGSFAIAKTSLDPVKRSVRVGEVSSTNGLLAITRLKDGKLELMSLVPASYSNPPAATPEARKTPWLLELGKLDVSRYAVDVVDLTPSTGPFKLSVHDIGVRLNGFSTSPVKTATLSVKARLDKRGAVSADGTVALDPVRVALKFKANDIALSLAEPYIRDNANVIIADGLLQASGKAAFNGKTGASELTADVSVDGLKVLDSARYEDVAAWKSLQLGGVHVTQNPDAITVGTITLTGLDATVGVAEDKSTNLSRLAVKRPVEPQPAISNAPAAKQPEIKVGDIIVKDGHLRISDNSIPQAYKGELKSLEGSISGISSIASEPARINMKTLWDGNAPISVTGTIKPFKDDLRVDINFKFDNMDLSTLTPYSGAFAGYKIEKGKLFVNTTTKIAGKELSSMTHLTVEQFNFGDSVDSDRAMKLPFKLAVSLLKDRKGTIALDLPVAGRTDDPDFSYGRIILDVIINLIAKAATSPFSLLASAFGGEELSQLTFASGAHELADTERRKLDALCGALNDRPALKLEVKGFAGAGADEEGLRQSTFERKLKAAKLRELVERGTRDAALETLTIEPAERSKYLAAAYKAESFKKPRNFIGLAKTLPDADMEALMKADVAVTAQDMRELAAARAREVIAYITSTGKVAPERIFLVEGEVTANHADKKTPSRVEFTLK